MVSPHRARSSPAPARWERHRPERRRWGRPRSCGRWSERLGSWSRAPVKTPTGRRWADIWSGRWTRTGWRWAATGRSTRRLPWRMAPASGLHSWPESRWNIKIITWVTAGRAHVSWFYWAGLNNAALHCLKLDLLKRASYVRAEGRTAAQGGKTVGTVCVWTRYLTSLIKHRQQTLSTSLYLKVVWVGSGTVSRLSLCGHQFTSLCQTSTCFVAEAKLCRNSNSKGKCTKLPHRLFDSQ